MATVVLKIRLPREALDALDAQAVASGVTRSAVARRLIRDGLAALDGEPVSMSWEDAAARLERIAPERWSSGDPALDQLLGE